MHAKAQAKCVRGQHMKHNTHTRQTKLFSKAMLALLVVCFVSVFALTLSTGVVKDEAISDVSQAFSGNTSDHSITLSASDLSNSSKTYEVADGASSYVGEYSALSSQYWNYTTTTTNSSGLVTDSAGYVVGWGNASTIRGQGVSSSYMPSGLNNQEYFATMKVKAEDFTFTQLRVEYRCYYAMSSAGADNDLHMYLDASVGGTTFNVGGVFEDNLTTGAQNDAFSTGAWSSSVSATNEFTLTFRIKVWSNAQFNNFAVHLGRLHFEFSNVVVTAKPFELEYADLTDSIANYELSSGNSTTVDSNSALASKYWAYTTDQSSSGIITNDASKVVGWGNPTTVGGYGSSSSYMVTGQNNTKYYATLTVKTTNFTFDNVELTWYGYYAMTSAGNRDDFEIWVYGRRPGESALQPNAGTLSNGELSTGNNTGGGGSHAWSTGGNAEDEFTVTIEMKIYTSAQMNQFSSILSQIKFRFKGIEAKGGSTTSAESLKSIELYNSQLSSIKEFSFLQTSGSVYNSNDYLNSSHWSDGYKNLSPLSSLSPSADSSNVGWGAGSYTSVLAPSTEEQIIESKVEVHLADFDSAYVSISWAGNIAFSGFNGLYLETSLYVTVGDSSTEYIISESGNPWNWSFNGASSVDNGPSEHNDSGSVSLGGAKKFTMILRVKTTSSMYNVNLTKAYLTSLELNFALSGEGAGYKQSIPIDVSEQIGSGLNGVESTLSVSPLANFQSLGRVWTTNVDHTSSEVGSWTDSYVKVGDWGAWHDANDYAIVWMDIDLGAHWSAAYTFDITVAASSIRRCGNMGEFIFSVSTLDRFDSFPQPQDYTWADDIYNGTTEGYVKGASYNGDAQQKHTIPSSQITGRTDYNISLTVPSVKRFTRIYFACWDGTAAFGEAEVSGLSVKVTARGVKSGLFNNASGTVSDPFKLTSREDFDLLSTVVRGGDTSTYNASSKHYKVEPAGGGNTIDFEVDGSTRYFIPIGGTGANLSEAVRPFYAQLDGNGTTITNMEVVKTARFSGLFGYISNARIYNLTLQDCTVAGGDASHAGLVGEFIGGTIVNCHITGNSTIEGTYQVGGFIGWGQGNMYIVNCTVGSGVTIRGTAPAAKSSTETNILVAGVGGFVGRAQDHINIGGTSTNGATVLQEANVGSNVYGVGGFVGHTIGQLHFGGFSYTAFNGSSTYCGATTITNNGTIGSDCGADVDGDSKWDAYNLGVGGILGYTNTALNATASDATLVNNGAITGRAVVGGIVGFVDNTTDGGVLSRAKNTGKIIARDPATFSSFWTATDNTNVGANQAYAGGIVGIIKGSVINCYNSGQVMDESHPEDGAGGIAGYAGGGSTNNVIKYCYNEGRVTAYSNISSIVGIFQSGTISFNYVNGHLDVSWNSAACPIGYIYGTARGSVTASNNWRLPSAGTYDSATSSANVNLNGSALLTVDSGMTVKGWNGSSMIDWTAIVTNNIEYFAVQASVDSGQYMMSTVQPYQIESEFVDTNGDAPKNVTFAFSSQYKSSGTAWDTAGVTVSIGNFPASNATSKVYNGQAQTIETDDVATAPSGYTTVTQYYSDNGMSSQITPIDAGTYYLNFDLTYQGWGVTGTQIVGRNNQHTFTITPAEIVITGWSDGTYVYNKNPQGPTVTNATISGVGVTVSNGTYNEATIEALKSNSSIVVTIVDFGTNAGSYTSMVSDTFTVTGSEKVGNYTITVGSGKDYTIDKSRLDVTISTGTIEKTYDGTVSATVSPTYAWSSTNGGDATTPPSVTCTATFDDENAGSNKTVSCTITLSNTSNYVFWVNNAESASIVKTATGEIIPKELTFSANNSAQTYTGEELSANATISGWINGESTANINSAVSAFGMSGYASTSSSAQSGDVATVSVSGSTVTISGVNVGYYFVKANTPNPANCNYSISANAVRTLTIVKNVLSIAWGTPSIASPHTYNGTNVTVTATISAQSGTTLTDSVWNAILGTDGEGAWIVNSISASKGVGSKNTLIAVANSTKTVTFTILNASEYTLKVSGGAQNTNYALETSTFAYTINPYQITADNVNGLTISNSSKTYDGQNQTVEADTVPTLTMFGIDTISLVYGYRAGEGGTVLVGACNAGTYDMVIAAVSATRDGSDVSGNYTVPEIIETGATFTINPATIKITGWKVDSYVFSNADQGPSVSSVTINGATKAVSNSTYSGATIAALKSGESIYITITGVGKNAGSHTLTVSSTFTVSANELIGNYTLATASKQYTISKSVLTVNVTPSVTSKVYDGTATFTTFSHSIASATGYKPADSVVRVTANYNSKDVAEANTITFVYTLTSTTNYSLSASSSTASGTITPATLTVELYLKNNKAVKTYDGNNSFASLTYTDGKTSMNSTKYRSGQGFRVSGFKGVTEGDILISGVFKESDEARSAFDAFVNNVVATTIDSVTTYSLDSGYYKKLVFTISGAGASNYVLSIPAFTGATTGTTMTVFDSADTVNDNTEDTAITISIDKKSIRASYGNTTQSYVTADNAYNTDWLEVTGNLTGVVSGDNILVAVTNNWMWIDGIVDGTKRQFTKYTIIKQNTSPSISAALSSADGTHLNYTLRNQPNLVIGYFVLDDESMLKINTFVDLMMATYYYQMNFIDADFGSTSVSKFKTAFTGVTLSKIGDGTADLNLTSTSITLTAEQYGDGTISETDFANVYAAGFRYWDEFFEAFVTAYNTANPNNTIDQIELDESGINYGYWVEESERVTYAKFKQTANISGILTASDLAILDGEFYDSGWGVGKTYLSNFLRPQAGGVITVVDAIFPMITADGTAYGFIGYYNGNGFTIENVNIVSTSASGTASGVGMFANVSAGTMPSASEPINGLVQNVHLRNFNINVNATGNVNVGGVVGYSQQTIESMIDCSFHGIINVNATGTVNVGGILGVYDANDEKIIDGAIAVGTIYVNGATINAGGIVGQTIGSTLTINDAVAMMSTYAYSSSATLGGIVGNGTVSITGNHTYVADSLVKIANGSATAVNKLIGSGADASGVSYTTLRANTVSAYYNNQYLGSISSIGSYDVIVDTEVNAVGGVSMRESMRLADIIDIYVLLYGKTTSQATITLSDQTTATIDVYTKAGTSWLVGTATGTSSSKIAIVNQQHVALLRELPFVSFSLAKTVTMYTGHSAGLFKGVFYGTIEATADATINLRNSNGDGSAQMFEAVLSTHAVPVSKDTATA